MNASTGIYRILLRGCSSLLVLVSCVCWLGGRPASADERYLFCTQDLPPYSMKDGNGGIGSEVVGALAQQLDWQVRIEVLPWQRAMAMARSGQCDAIFTVIRTPERESFLLYPATPLMQQAFAFYVRRESDIVYEGPLDRFVGRSDLSFGMTRDKSYAPAIDALWHAGAIHGAQVAARSELTIGMFLAGRFDVLVENQAYADYALRLAGASNDVRMLRPLIDQVPLFVALSRSGRLAGKLAEFDGAMRSISRDGTLARILSRYGSSSE